MGTSSTDCILEVTDHIVISENCESMKSYLLLFVIWLAMLRNTSTAATNHHTKDVSNRVIELKGIIEKGKFEKDVHELDVIVYKEKIDNYTCPCLWATWSEWSACSKTCEAGTKSRTRNVETNVRNVPCIGGSSANVTCNDVCCPVDCDWGAWEAWSACPSGCPLGGGLQNKTRTRTKSVEAFCNGNDCQGEVFEKEPCSREEEVVKEHSVVLKECDQSKLEKNQCMSQKNQLAIDLEECKKRSEKSEEKVPDQCRTYMNFTTNRLYTNKVKSYHCDKEGAWKPSPDWRGPGWYRYVGGEEKRMALRHEVTQPYQCGTSYGDILRTHRASLM